MGQLVRQAIRSLYNGVSRQPASARLPGQVQSADNVTFSVVTGGFSKRAGAELVSTLSADDDVSDAHFYSYKRDSDEAYLIAVSDSRIHVWSKTGKRIPVQMADGASDYLKGISKSADVGISTLADATVIVNKNVTTRMDDDNRSPAQAYSYGIVQMLEFVIKASYWIQIDFSRKGDPRNSGTVNIKCNPLDSDLSYDAGVGASYFVTGLRGLLLNDDPGREASGSKSDLGNGAYNNWTVERSGSFIFIRALASDGLPYDEFVVSARDSRGGGTMKCCSSFVADADDLSSKAWGGMITRIGGIDDRDGNQYFTFVLVPEDGTRYPDRQAQLTGDGSTTDFTIPFDFGHSSDLSVLVSGSVVSNYRVGSSKDGSTRTLKFNGAPGNGASILIRYQAPSEEPTYGSGYWKETTEPNSVWQFDAGTMPHVLLRNSSGGFSFGPLDGSLRGSDGKPLTWAKRRVGDAVSVPNPDFIDKKLTGIGFHRSRLYFLAGEYVYFGQSSDYFNFWPEGGAQVIASDPFGRAAGTRQVHVLKQAYPFRKSLVISAEQTQFEVSAPNALTPDQAAIDPSTEYTIEADCEPVALGSEIYFATRNGGSADVLEYYYDDSSLNNDATRIAIHVANYIPAPIVEMAGDSTTGTLFVRSSSEPHSIYNYRLYWSGREKDQSAWGRWTFSAKVLTAQVFDDHLWMIHRTPSGTLALVRIPMDDDAQIDSLPFPCRMDYWRRVRGSYSPADRQTTWTLGDDLVADATCVLSEGFGPTLAGRPIDVQTKGKTVTRRGDWSKSDVFLGAPFVADVRLSTQYIRDQDNHTTSAGRLQMRTVSVDYVNSGEFDVVISPDRRSDRTTRKSIAGTGRPEYQLDKEPPLNDGSISAAIRGRNTTTAISIRSSSPTPFTITSADWLGFYNEVSRNR